jgi:CheY-like chemotaxis protein
MHGRCDYVDNGEAAVDLVLANLRMRDLHPDLTFWSYSLILLDYSMPNMDGPATAINICKAYQQYNKKPPYIVCLTAFTEKIYKDKACQSGMSEFISKPIDNMKLKKIMREQNVIL